VSSLNPALMPMTVAMATQPVTFGRALFLSIRSPRRRSSTDGMARPASSRTRSQLKLAEKETASTAYRPSVPRRPRSLM